MSRRFFFKAIFITSVFTAQPEASATLWNVCAQALQKTGWIRPIVIRQLHQTLTGYRAGISEDAQNAISFPLPTGLIDTQGLRHEIERRIGQSVQLGIDSLPPDRFHGAGENLILGLEDGTTIGTFSYFFENDILQLGLIRIGPEYKAIGISTYLFSEVLGRVPHFKKIEVVYILDNEAVLFSGLRRGLSCEEAIRKTYTFRMLSRFGYTQISDPECERTQSYYAAKVSSK